MSFHNLLTSSKQLSLEDVGEGNLEVELPTIWTDEKAEVGRVREEKRREKERRSEKRKSQKKEDGRKVAKHCVFLMFLWLWRVEK